MRLHDVLLGWLSSTAHPLCSLPHAALWPRRCPSHGCALSMSMSLPLLGLCRARSRSVAQHFCVFCNLRSALGMMCNSCVCSAACLGMMGLHCFLQTVLCRACTIVNTMSKHRVHPLLINPPYSTVCPSAIRCGFPARRACQVSTTLT